jgi:sortase A
VQRPDDAPVAPDDRPARRRRQRRPSRWDRPKPPKDWRWFVGGLGRILIATGVLLFAFVGYQLWGTAIQEAQSQQRLENEFESLVADLATSTPPATTATTTTTTTTAPANPSDTTPSPVTEPPRPSDTAAPQLLPPIQPGDPVAIIEMPTIDVHKVVVASVQTEALKKGPGHFSNTPLPGQLGNAGIAGHRTTFGQPFFRLDELQAGDPIVVTTPFGTYTYRVTGQTIVGGGDGYVLNTVDPERATLTLVTCHPRYTSRQRLIVFADLDPAASDPVGQPLVQYRPLGSPDPEPPAVEELPGEELPGEEPESSVSPETTVAPAEPDDVEDGVQDEAEEVFGGGWFEDQDAWPQIALWGFALILVSVAATLISRTFRRNWVGFLVGIGPFVVVLYFWFQNVNRMLPPGL